MDAPARFGVPREGASEVTDGTPKAVKRLGMSIRMLRRVSLGAATMVMGALLMCTAYAAKAPQERAREAVTWLVQEKYEELEQAASAEVRKIMPAAAMQSQIGPFVRSLGKFKQFGEASERAMGASTIVTLRSQFETGAVDFTVTINEAGEVTGLHLAPVAAWKRPEYSKPDAFIEREVTVGSGEWKLPGTLTLPKSAQPVAAVVLVHGSGPNDRDETIAGNMPFKDLAEGLASNGIAVLRYEKRTKFYGAKMLSMRELTVQQESIDDALAGAALLRGLPEIDPKRVFYVGHSLGGYLLPKLLQQDARAAGGVSMAGCTRPIEELMLEQYEYLIPLQTAGSDAAKVEGQKKLDEMRQAVAAIRALQPGYEDGPAIVGVYPHYWMALRGYDPPAVARTIAQPMFILQGERDYQVTMVDFANWQKALGGKDSVTLKSYPALNHLFITGQGKSTPSEYGKPGHVAAEAITDIAGWVSRH